MPPPESLPSDESGPRAQGSIPPPGYSPTTAAYGAGPVPPGAFAPPAPAPQPIGDYQLASWGSRALALIIDNILVMLASIVVVAAVIGGLLAALFSLVDGAGAGAVTGAIIGGFGGYFLGLFLQPRWMANHNGQTIGKQVIGIRTIRVNGQPTDLGWSSLRQIAVIWLLFGIVGGSFFIPWVLNYLWPLWDEENRALHDMLVQSRVVKA